MITALVIASLMTLISSSLLIGVVTKDAAIISSTNVFEKNGVAMRGDYDWIRQLGEECLVGVQGDSSDCDFLLTQLESSNGEHLLRYGRSLPSKSIANLCRKIIAKYLRVNQLKVSVLIAGWNRDENCPSLHWLDSIGAHFLKKEYECFTTAIIMTVGYDQKEFMKQFS
jgi:20S proteasome alpha/beta subunit